MKPSTLMTLLILLLSVAMRAQVDRQTIPEILARGGESTSGMSMIPSGLAPTMTAVLADTDVIVRGIVGEPRSYLSDDQFDILTDYPILNPVILYQPVTARSIDPAVRTPTITATLRGGTIKINDLTYTFTALALPSLEPGTEGLFLLKRVGNQFRIASAYYGAFRIADSKLIPLTRKQGFAQEYVGPPAAQVAEKLVIQRRALRR